jgi:SAM-dependent methyltransferase
MDTVGGVIDERAVPVARRAAEQARAAGITLGDELRLWHLAGGRPVVEAVAGRPEELGELLEAGFPPRLRQRLGAHYTPAALATGLVERALAGRDCPRVGDPACGGGALLLAAARLLAGRGVEPEAVVGRLWGMDIDPVAVATAEAALALWAGVAPPAGHVVVGDALLDAVSWPPLDVVVGNPPFLSQLGADTTRTSARSAQLRRRFDTALRAYTDTAGLFLLAACELVTAGGIVALLQPQSVLAARDAAGVRAAVGALGEIVDVWFPSDARFDAAIDVCVPFVAVGDARPGQSWSAHLARAHGVPAVELRGRRVLGDDATTTAAFRSEYYGMAAHVFEQADCPAGRPLVTTGLVDLGHCAWGERPARMARRAWQRPVLDVAALEGRAAAWAARTSGPKLLVATQTRVVEVVVDEAGRWVPGVPLVVVLAPPERLGRLAAALASPAVTAWLLQQTAGSALSPEALKVTARLLREVPLPIDEAAWEAGSAAFRAHEAATFAHAMTAAYGVPGEVAEWWLARAATVWSPGGLRR